MEEPLTLNTIERLAMGIFAQLAPLTGDRGHGTVTVTADAGPDPFVLARNAYLWPVVAGVLRPDMPFKVAANPATLAADGTGGDWPIPAGTSGPVAVLSNVGGAQHNLPAGTVFRFNPPQPDFAATATLDAAVTDASGDGALVQRVAFFEELDSANPGKDLFSAALGNYPALMLVWRESTPAEGPMTGLRQGGTRAARGVRFFRESFSLYVVTTRFTSDPQRRQDGLIILQGITRLISDRMMNDDGEHLTRVGAGVEITGRDRLRRGEKIYVYAIDFRVNQVMTAIDSRSYNRWLKTAYTGTLPGREAPEPTTPLTLVDAEYPQP
jgi:hypothetical protein